MFIHGERHFFARTNAYLFDEMSFKIAVASRCRKQVDQRWLGDPSMSAAASQINAEGISRKHDYANEANLTGLSLIHAGATR